MKRQKLKHVKDFITSEVSDIEKNKITESLTW